MRVSITNGRSLEDRVTALENLILDTGTAAPVSKYVAYEFKTKEDLEDNYGARADAWLRRFVVDDQYDGDPWGTEG